MAERKRLLLRLDPQVYEAVAHWAADDLRSVNAQIEHALRAALRSAGRPIRTPRSASASGPAGESTSTGEGMLEAWGDDEGAGRTEPT